jgi:hypothetical protein
MKKEMFEEVVKSVREGGQSCAGIGAAQPARRASSYTSLRMNRGWR